MPIIELPDGREVDFPDDMDNAAIAAAIKRNFPEFATPAASEAAAPAPAHGLVGLIGDAARGISSAIGGMGDTLRNMPIIPPENGESVVDRMKHTPVRDEAPEGITPFTWARARAQEQQDPLDPRLAAIAPADELAKAQNIASARANAGNKLYAGVMARAREDNARAAAEAQRQSEMYSLENLAGNTGKNLQNAAASALKIGPTVVKGVADIGRLLSGDRIGKDTSESFAARMKVIDEVVAHASLTEQGKEFSALMNDPNADVGDLFAYLQANPEVAVDQGITTIGSMFLPAGAAMGAVKGAQAANLGAAGVRTAATVATMGTVAAQNAADTFTSEQLADASMEDRYRAATVAGAISLLAGIATRGGAEGEIARRIAGELSAGRTTLQAAGKFIAAAGKEGIQEATEEFGGAAGEAVGTLTPLDPNNTMKRMAFAATLGAVIGGGTHLTGDAAPDDGSAAAEAARQAALNKWNTQGFRPGPGPADGRREPTWAEAANPVPPEPAAPAPTVDDIMAASSVDEAIAAAQAVAASTTASPHATAADIDALEEVAGFGEPGNIPAPVLAENLPLAPQAAPALDPAGKNSGAWAMATEPAAPAEPANLTNLASSPDEDSWHAFPTETGTLGIPRAEMPQIKAEHRGAMTQFLKGRGITHDELELDAESLKPTQQEFSLSKVQKAIDHQGGNRAILISSDGHVLDGHHQWLASAEKGEPIRAIRLNAPIRQLLDTVREFPSAGVDAASAGTAQPIARPGQELLDANAQRQQKQDDAVRAAAESLAKRKATGGQRARERLKQENPFLGFLASHGVQIDERSDTGGEKGRKGGVMVPGYGPLYRKGGKRLDELAQLAQEAGFLSQQDIDEATDTGGTRKLAELIQRAVQGKEVIRPAGMLEAAAPSADQALLAEAQRLGIDAEGKSADQLYDDVAAAHAGEESRREATGASSIDEQDAIDRYADGFSAEEARMAADLLRDADIPLDGGTPSDNLTDEDIDAIFGLQPEGARADGGQAQESAAGAAREGAEGAGQPGEGEPLLSSYTQADVLERERADADRAQARQTERDKLETQRKKEQDDKEIRARLDASAENFQLGQDAMDSLSGQGGLFDAPPSAAAAPAPTARDTKKAPPTQQAEDVDDGSDIPLAFYAQVTVQHRVYSDDGSNSTMMDVPADVALESVREDIQSIEAMLKCMGG